MMYTNNHYTKSTNTSTVLFTLICFFFYLFFYHCFGDFRYMMKEDATKEASNCDVHRIHPVS